MNQSAGDGALVRDSRDRRDLVAYGELVRRYQDVAVATAFSVLSDPAMAEDAAQEAFLYAFLHLGTLREPSAFKGWLRRIVMTQALRLTRTAAWQARTLDGDAADTIAAVDAGPEELAHRTERRARVATALRALPTHLRITFALFYFADCSVAETAAAQDVTAGAVRKRLHDARLRLRAELSEEELQVTKDEMDADKPSRDGQFSDDVVALLRAVAEGDEKVVRRLLGKNPRLASTAGPHPIWGGAPLPVHVAAERNQLAVVRQLLDGGADPNGAGADYDGWSPLLLAAHGGRLGIHAPRSEIVELLVTRGADVDIFTAALLGDAQRVSELLNTNAGLATATGPAGATALHFVRDPAIADALISAGADPAAVCGWDTTPLERASFRGEAGMTVAARLLGAGVVAHTCALACLGDVARLRVLLDANPDALEERRKVAPSIVGTPLHGAAQWGQQRVSALLIAAGADVNARADSGQTPLHLCASAGNLELVRLLVAAGADVNAVDDEHGTTPLVWAQFFHENLDQASEGVQAVVRYLESA